MRRIALTACMLALGITSLSCGSSTTAPSSITIRLHGELTDPAGDALSDGRVAIAPDLVRATIDVDEGTIAVAVSFAPGTLDRQTARVSLLLDTDSNTATGIAQTSGLGADYALDVAASTGQVAITKANSSNCAAHLSCFDPIASTSVAFGNDTLHFTIPIAMVGGADGRMAFQLHSYVLVAPLTPVIFDDAPDIGFGRVQ